MIDSVGYTEDGGVWMNILFKHNKEPIKMVVTMSQEQAMEVSGSLAEAANKAAKYKDKIISSNGNDGVTKCQKPQEH